MCKRFSWKRCFVWRDPTAPWSPVWNRLNVSIFRLERLVRWVVSLLITIEPMVKRSKSPGRGGRCASGLSWIACCSLISLHRSNRRGFDFLLECDVSSKWTWTATIHPGERRKQVVRFKSDFTDLIWYRWTGKSFDGFPFLNSFSLVFLFSGVFFFLLMSIL